jgi:hypothetical protein
MDYSKNSERRGIWSTNEVLECTTGRRWQYAGGPKEPGTLWAWGLGASGRLGIN